MIGTTLSSWSNRGRREHALLLRCFWVFDGSAVFAALAGVLVPSCAAAWGGAQQAVGAT